jgi:hypothetical protein
VILVEDYRRRDLTKPSDRIMAFSGVARSYQAEHGSIYLAGMWKEHFPLALLSYHVWDIRYEVSAKPLATDLMEPPSESVPTWSWFASPIYLRWVTYFADDLYSRTSQLLFFTKLSQFRWCKLPINHVPPTAYHDFDGLQITLELATYTTTVLPFWSHDAREMNCESLGTQLASLLGVSRGDVTALYICDDLKEIDQPPTKIYIALVGEGWDKDKKCHLFEGLALAPGTEKETYKRVGYWSGSVRCEDKYTPVFRRAICKCRYKNCI